MTSPRLAVVLLAAGEGRRVGADTNKVLLPLAGMPVFAWSLRAVQAMEYVDQVVVVVREQDHAAVQDTITHHFPDLDTRIVHGGETRHASEWNALQALAPAIDAGKLDVVAIHDTARPLAGADLFNDVAQAAFEHGGALPVRTMHGLALRDTATANVTGTPALVGVQTPQAFRARPLLEAYRAAGREGFVGTDTASCVEKYTDLAIQCVPCPATNIKITFPEDVSVAERLLGRLAAEG